jgi:protein tyrosine phosphatase
VQTEEQFIFIYDVLLESLKSGETELNETNYQQFIDDLNEPVPKLIDRHFALITEYRPSEWQLASSQLACNAPKNRNSAILPVNASRAILSRQPGVDGSDYINASFLHGCSRQDEFLVTQYPLPHTKSAFWQMVSLFFEMLFWVGGVSTTL